MRSVKAILGDRETIVVARSASIADAARLMAAHHIGALPVLDGRLAGIVSMRDVLAADVDEKAEELTMLNAYVHYIPAHMQVRTARP